MELFVLDDIEAKIDVDKLSRELRVEKGGAEFADKFGRLVEEALSTARPKAVYKPVDFDKEGDDRVVIDGITLKSRVLSVNLADVHRVFPFVGTCGRELEDWSKTKEDMLEQFWAESIMDSVLLSAMAHMGEHIVKKFSLGKTAVMTPGSLADWPIQEQKPLFTILGNIEESIGVRLKESFMMDPRQSVSGILFPTEISFESCQLCPRERCPKRRAPYDSELYEKRFQAK